MKEPLKLLFLTLLFIAGALSLYASDFLYDIQHIDLKDGLPSRKVYSVHKDSKGFMWFGFRGGFARYDGYEWKKFNLIKSDFGRGPVRFIWEDRDNNLWLFSYTADILRSSPGSGWSNVNAKVFLRRSQEIIDLQDYLGKSFDKSVSKISFVVAEDDYIWLSFIDGEIYRFGATMELKMNYQTDGEYSFAFAPYQGHVGAILKKKEVITFSRDGKALKKHTISGLNSEFLFDHSGRLWYGNPKAKDNFREVDFFDDNKTAKDVIPSGKCQIEKGIIPLHPENRFRTKQTKDGLYWELLNQQYFNVYHNGVLQKNIMDDLKDYYGRISIYALYIDPESIAWITTDQGVFKATLTKNPFRKFIVDLPEKFSLRNITEDEEGWLYVNSYAQVVKLNPKTGETLLVSEEKLYACGLGFLLEGNTLWSGVYKNRVMKYDLSSEAVDSVILKPLETNPSPSITFWTYREKVTGDLLIGTNSGLYKADDNARFAMPYEKFNDFNQLSESSIYACFQNDKGVWIGTGDGLFLIDPLKGVEAEFNLQNGRLPFNYIVHINELEPDVLLLSSRGDGFVIWDTRTGKYEHFTTANGLSNNTVYCAYPDDYGYIWMPSDFGLMRMEAKTGIIQIFLEEDGITNNEFNYLSHFEAEDGTLFFGGLDGMVGFHPENFINKSHEVMTPFRMTSFKVLDGGTGKLIDRTNDFMQNADFEIFPKDKAIQLEFSLLNFKGKTNNQYAYRIKPFEKEWSILDDNRLYLGRLPYGSCMIELKAKAKTSVRESPLLAIPIKVYRPFYLRFWFIAISIISFISLVAAGVWSRFYLLRLDKERLEREVLQRTKKIREQYITLQQQAKELEEVNNTKDKFFSIIAHDLRRPMLAFRGVVKKVNYLLRKKQFSRIEEMGGHMDHEAAKLSKLLDNLLQWSLVEQGRIPYQPEVISIFEIAHDIIESYRNLAEVKNVKVINRLEQDINAFADKQGVSAILRNLVDNAIKFTEKGGSVVVNGSKSSGMINITVKDTGIGIPQEKLDGLFKIRTQRSSEGTLGEIGTGIGLTLCKELAEINHGEIKVESFKGEGTVFKFSLPAKKINQESPKN